MRRREFVAGLGSAVAWPAVARAQQDQRMRRIGVLLPYHENDPLAKARISAFTQALADLGWTDGRNVRMDLRWATVDTNRIGAFAKELVVPRWAMCGRLRVGKGFLHAGRLGRSSHVFGLSARFT
jgi:putative ABC transport system substrate-binding protein